MAPSRGSARIATATETTPAESAASESPPTEPTAPETTATPVEASASETTPSKSTTASEPASASPEASASESPATESASAKSTRERDASEGQRHGHRNGDQGRQYTGPRPGPSRSRVSHRPASFAWMNAICRASFGITGLNCSSGRSALKSHPVKIAEYCGAPGRVL